MVVALCMAAQAAAVGERYAKTPVHHVHAPAAPDRSSGVQQSLNLMHACRPDAVKLCRGHTEVVKCLDQQRHLLQGSECKLWIRERRDCMADVVKLGCKLPLRVCLLTEQRSLSEQCAQSDFYRSVVRAEALLARREKAINPGGSRVPGS